MKTKLKIFKFIALFALFNSFYSCQEDEISIESDKKTFDLKTSRVSIGQVINEINSQDFKQKLQNKNFDSSISNSLLRSSDSEVYFIKKEKDDELTTYILHLHSYSQSKPYFLKLIITQNNNETERMGYIKYIPTSPISIIDMTTFSGEVQILDNNYEVNATSNYLNGVKQENVQNNNSQNRIICTDEIIITEVKCSHGGNHGVGQSCNNGLVNDAHYVISIFTRCTGDRTTPTQIIEDYGNGNPSLGAGGSINEVLSNILSPEELTWWNNATQEQKQPILDYINPNINNGDAWIYTKEAIKTIVHDGEVDFENKIMIDSTFKNNQKAMCVYNKMRTINSFNKALAPFEGENPNAFIKLKTEILPNDIRAETSEPDSNNIIEIKINDCANCTNGINYQPNTLIAQTIIHEIIHAEFFRQIIEAVGNGTYSTDYDEVVNALKNSKYQKLANYIQTKEDWSHNYMAEQFRRAIARVTQQFDTNIEVTGIPLPLYTNLAWRGLDEIDVTSWMELPIEIRNSIHNTIDTFTLNNSNQPCQN